MKNKKKNISKNKAKRREGRLIVASRLTIEDTLQTVTMPQTKFGKD